MSTQKIGIEAARPILGDLADQANEDGQVTILTRTGKPVAAITPLAGAMSTPAYTDRLFTQPQEHTLYPRPEHRYECCQCAASGYHYPATGEVFAYHTCVKRSGHIWVYEDTMQTEGTGDRVFETTETTGEQS
jgi:antitoxin (DNA-binding transcriptional repressor) of toxin-antitoxin stability system